MPKDIYSPEAIAAFLHSEQEEALIRAGEGQFQHIDIKTDRRHKAGLVAVKVWENILETDIDKLRAEVEEWREVGRELSKWAYYQGPWTLKPFLDQIRYLLGKKP